MPPSISLADTPPPAAPESRATRSAPGRNGRQRFTVLPGFGLSLGFTIF